MSRGDEGKESKDALRTVTLEEGMGQRRIKYRSKGYIFMSLSHSYSPSVGCRRSTTVTMASEIMPSPKKGG